MYIWAISVAVVATDAWAQYLGALKSISKRYLNPNMELADATGDGNAFVCDFDEITNRDPGVIAKIALKEREEEHLHGLEGESVRKRARRFRREFRRALLAAIAAFLVASSYLLLPVPPWFALIVFAASVMTNITFWIALRRLVGSISLGFQDSRTSAEMQWRSDELYQMVQNLNPSSDSFFESLLEAANVEARRIPEAASPPEHRTAYSAISREYQMWALAALTASWTYRNFERKVRDGHCNAHRLPPALHRCEGTVSLHENLQRKVALSLEGLVR